MNKLYYFFILSYFLSLLFNQLVRECEKELTKLNFPQQLVLLHEIIKRLKELQKPQSLNKRLEYLLGLQSFAESLNNKQDNLVIQNFEEKFGKILQKLQMKCLVFYSLSQLL